MRIPRISVVLNGDDNDKLAVQTAVRLAAREQAQVRVFLGTACSLEIYEKHLDFVLWDVQERLRLAAPEVTVVSPLDAVAVAEMQEEPVWICG
jgi:hypothetical protein